jgi:arsenite/tail-anchored protein-transporting ATPase
VRILQVDAEAQFERLRGEYRADVTEALERIGLSAAAVLDRRVIDAVLDLAPPGIDEFAALAALIDAAAADETVVIDAAPTGHFLRLLTMPALALDWTRQLMRLIVKYRIAGQTGSAAETLLRTARELRALDERLHDSTRAGVVVVTTDQPMVRAETERLLGALADAGVPVMAVLDNMSGGSEPPPGADWHRVVRAPRRGPAPIGVHALLDFAKQWKVER